MPPRPPFLSVFHERVCFTKASDSQFLSPAFGSFSSAVVSALSTSISDNVCLEFEDTFSFTLLSTFCWKELPSNQDNPLLSSYGHLIWASSIGKQQFGIKGSVSRQFFCKPSLRSIGLSLARFRCLLTAWHWRISSVRCSSAEFSRQNRASHRLTGPPSRSAEALPRAYEVRAMLIITLIILLALIVASVGRGSCSRDSTFQPFLFCSVPSAPSLR